MNDLISVIVTIYNREKYLKECLDSLKEQTYTNFEAILIDDGSTDSSIQIAKSYADTDQRFKLTTSEHIGFSAAKNLGLSKVQGKYIIFLDSDDTVYPCWLEFLYKACTNTGADISTCYYDEYIEGKTNKLPIPPLTYYLSHPFYIAEYSYLKMNLVYYNFCSCYLWNKLVKKELYDGIVFKDQIALSDISEIYKIVDKANKVIQVQTPLIHYRRHMESTGGECSKIGLDYWIFRADVLEESMKFIWENYPQSRYAIQCALLSELTKMQKHITKEEFMLHIDRQFFKLVFSTRVMPYVFQNPSEVNKK